MSLRFIPGAGLAMALLLIAAPALAENLQQVFQQALQQDPEIRMAEAESQSLRQALPIAGSRFLPSLSIYGDISRYHEDVTSGGTVTGGSYAGNSMGATLVQPILHMDAFKQRSQAGREVAKADLAWKAAQQDLILRVAGQYFEVLAASDNLGFARVEKAAIEKQLEQTRQRFNVGLIAITDVHESQARFDLAVAQEIDAENRLANAHEAIREITGQYYQELSALLENTPLEMPQPSNVDEWVRTALEQNLELLAAHEDRGIAELEIKRRRAERYPTLDLVGGVSTFESDYGMQSDTTERSSVALQLNWKLYDGGYTGARVTQASQDARQATDNLEFQQRAVVRDVRNAYLAVLAGISRVRAFNQAVISNRSALKATEAGAEVGTRTTVDVLDARTALYLAQRNYAQSRYDYIMATLLLKRAAGILDTGDLQRVNAWLAP